MSNTINQTVSVETRRLINKRCGIDHVPYRKPGPWTRSDRLDNLEVALRRVTLDGHYMEFGVYKGETINFIADRIHPRKILGFDSFEGLPDDSAKHERPHWFKGAYKADAMPAVRENVELVVGLFSDTLPAVAADIKRIAFVHVDCDLYSSTRTIFQDLGHAMVGNGTVVVFDEFQATNHEPLAFAEWLEEKDLYGICINRTAGDQQVTFVISTTGSMS